MTRHGVIDHVHTQSDCPRKTLFTVCVRMVRRIAKIAIIRARARAIVPK